MGWLIWLLTVSLHAALAVSVARVFGVMLGSGIYVLSILIFMAIAGTALKSTSVNQITWKNRLAGWFLPWTHWVGGGSLSTLLIKNASVSILLGVILIWCDSYGWLHELVGVKSRDKSIRFSWLELVILWATVVCWGVLILAWSLLVRSWAASQLNVLSVLLKGPGNWLPFLLPPIAVSVSIVMRYLGFTGWALGVVAVPLLITTGPVLLMLAVFLWHHIRGKPIRWN